jgi:hypothetical protein
VQLIEGLGSPGVELGVDQVRSLAFAYPGRYRLTGGLVHRRGPGSAKKHKCRGLTVIVRETMNSAQGFLIGYSNSRGPP